MAWQKSHKYRVWVGSGVAVSAILVHQLTPLLTLIEPDRPSGEAIQAYFIIRLCAWVAAFVGIHMAFLGVVLHWRATAGVSRSSWVCSLAAILLAIAAFVALWLGEQPYFDYLETLISPSDPGIILMPAYAMYWAVQLAAASYSAFIALMLARHHWHWFTLGSVLPLGWMVFRFCAFWIGS